MLAPSHDHSTVWSGPTMTSARFDTPVGSKRTPKARVDGGLWNGVGEHRDRHAERLTKGDLAVGLVDRHPVELGALRGEVLEDLLVV